ncbi:MAG: tetratricopeptide repeat protein [Bacteroidales bacterium]|nr:tetratricopeptide repeat protein [Bacteroidales bacterium]MDD3890684.1 tetratricopeptide repeat protein [Bacteroidales bacterium]
MLRLLHMITVTMLVSIMNLHGNENLDSLRARLAIEKSDSVKLELLIDKSRFFNKDIKNVARCEEILSQALSIAKKDSAYWALSKVHNSYGMLYRNIAEYGKALEHHKISLRYAEKSKNKHLISNVYNNIGVVYRRMDNHPKAAQNHLLALKAADAVKDTFNTAVSLNSLGNIYSLSGQYQEAFSYFKRALALSLSMDNNRGKAINYNNIGEVFEFMGVYDSAMVYYTESLKVNLQINSLKGKAISYNCIGKIHLYQGKAKEALNLFEQALKIDLELGDKKFITDSYVNLGRAYCELNILDKAEEFSQNGLEMANHIGSIMHTQLAYETLSKIYEKRKLSSTALYYFKKSTTFKDSIINEKNSRAIATMDVMYEIDKKEQDIQFLKQAQEINQKELARQLTIRNFYLAGFVFALLVVAITFYAFNIKRKSNRLLRQQKAEIEENNKKLNQQQDEILAQNEEIRKHQSNSEQKNKYLEEAYKVIEGYIGKITDSIRYAERIQKAILPPLNIASSYFSDSFTLYKPKDFVSGDFYWLYLSKETLYLAVADCTGHGVPGAFMSIIGTDLLNLAVNQQNIKEPAAILEFLNIELRNKLRKDDDDELVLKDSMDIGIIKYNLGSSCIDYSGALIPLTIVRNKKILEFKPNFSSIGMSTRLYSKPFKQEQIKLYSGDWVYMYSDGYMDQFGGERNKKFMRNRFLSTLLEVSIGTGSGQKAELNRIFKSWQGNNEQIDDVLVLGFKV